MKPVRRTSSVNRRLRRLLSGLLVAFAVAPGAAAGLQPRHTLAAPVIIKTTEGGFHWGDAGIGAVGAVAIGVIAVGVRSAIRNR